MNPLYHVDGICPRTDIQLGRCGFCIQLFPAWKEAVAASKLNPQRIQSMIDNMHRPWLDGCGFNAIFDPDEDPRAKWESDNLGKPRKYSKSAHPLYGRESIHVAWGEWGPEHITVPGNACGLDIFDGLGRPLGGMLLAPHNIDSPNQVLLLLAVFTTIAGYLIMEENQKGPPHLAASLSNSMNTPQAEP